MDLFDTIIPERRPLAEKLRPKVLEDFAGQSSVLRVLRPYLNAGRTLPNMILWGPPGCGKTTLARILAEHSGSHFINLNAIETGTKEIRQLGEQAHRRKIEGLGETPHIYR